MGRKRTAENRDLPETILTLISNGTNHIKDINQVLKRHPKQIYTYINKLVLNGYLEQVKQFYFLRNNIEWCNGCNLIPNKTHPQEWCI